MSALTVTLGADITALKRGMVAAAQLVAVAARRMSAIGASGLAGIGKGRAAALEGASFVRDGGEGIHGFGHRGD